MRKYWIWLDRRLIRRAGNIVRNPDKANRFGSIKGVVFKSAFTSVLIKNLNFTKQVMMSILSKSNKVMVLRYSAWYLGKLIERKQARLRKSCWWGACRRW